MSIELIWAQDYSSGIGKEGDLPWKIPEDLTNFKKITIGHTIIMGRKTWDSLPFRPLPKRTNIVLSSKKIDGIKVYQSINKCLKAVKQLGVTKIFIIGGESVYKSFLPKASVLHLTLVDQKTEGIDTFFPVSISEISKNFKKIETVTLSSKATYTKWVSLNENPQS